MLNILKKHYKTNILQSKAFNPHPATPNNPQQKTLPPNNSNLLQIIYYHRQIIIHKLLTLNSKLLTLNSIKVIIHQRHKIQAHQCTQSQTAHNGQGERLLQFATQSGDKQKWHKSTYGGDTGH